ncbi:MAG: AAA family ATPase [Acidobacteriota bacterium]|nr:AAA family ATPase [Acidobacteriota bacterium]MDE3264292.1 AAA family ATPase [Acidobacteriota bacterium]
MKILRVRAHEFGKLNGELDLAPGMTAIHGDNEAGKSTWLQAIFAALCGRRRGRGANTLEEREFERQYKPWSGRQWRATVKFQLDDGRRIEIQQRDLDTKESVAHDADTGRPIGDEIIYSGSIDGSRFLGLNRQVMPSTLVIGQGDIQRLRQKSERKGDEASALKEELQRAAASAGGAATAVEALRTLTEYASEEIGLERRNSTKPLQRSIDRAAAAREALEDGRSRHKLRTSQENELFAARDWARSANSLVKAWEGLHAERELERLETRLAEIERLTPKFPNGAPQPGEDTEAPDGDSEVAPEVAVAARTWRAATEARSLREQLGPGEPPETVISKSDEAAVRRALEVLEMPPAESLDEAEQRVAALRDELEEPGRQLEAAVGLGRWPWVGGTMGSLLVVLGLIDLLPRPFGIAGALLALACSLLIYRTQKRLRLPPPPPSHEQASRSMDLADAKADLRDLKRKHKRRERLLEAARNELSEFGLEADAEAVRTALAALGEREAWGREQALWLSRTEAARSAETTAEAALRTALGGRSVEDPDSSVAGLLDRYEQRCRRNANAAAGWERRLQEQRQDWDRLQRLLDGSDRESLAARRDAAAARANQTADSLPAETDDIKGLDDHELERTLAEARADAVNARIEVNRHEVQLAADADLPSLAELEEERAAAEREVDLLRRANDILDKTREHLEAAQDEVHRMLAPDLREALQKRLSLVSDGRYSAVRIDPEEGMEVQLEVEDGVYRSATELSHGTVDQTYLLLRIGLAEALGDKKESAPLFLDDATVHSDTARTSRFLDLLLALSDERQIVVFSQEEEVRRWAARRLAGDPRHRLIELGPEGLPLHTGVDMGPAAADAAEPAPDPERQHSLL